MLSHLLPVKILPQQNEVYNTKFTTNVVWKQLSKDPHMEQSNVWKGNSAYGTTSISNKKCTYTITTKNSNQSFFQTGEDAVSFTRGHIYLISCWLTVPEDQAAGVYTGNSATIVANLKANVRTRVFNVFKSNVTSTRSHYIYPARNGGLSVGSTAILEDACLYDLTEMFGEGKEMLGRFSFLSNFPNNYYDYNVDGDLVPFAIPVYGGSLNIKTGLLQITKYNIDLGYLYWQYSAAQASTGKYRKVCTEVLFEATSSESDEADLISSGYQTLTNAVSYQFTQGIAIATNSRIYICDDRYPLQNDMPAFANAVKGITACGVMASPVTYQLTSHEVRTLLRYNKISSNATELQFTYVNNQNETVALTGSNEYTIDDGVLNRSASVVNQIFEPIQDLHGYDYPWSPGGGENLMHIEDIELFKVTDLVHINSTRTGFYGTDEDLAEMFNGGEWGYIPILGQDILNPVGIKEDTPYTLYFRAYTDAEESTSGYGLRVCFYTTDGTRTGSIRLRNNYTSEREFTYTTFDPDRGEPEYTLGGITIEGDSGLCGNTWHFEFMSLAEGTSYLPYSNICPVEGHTESIVTVEGTPIPDSELERRLKAITRPAFQWDVGLKLKFEGYTFADGTLCQFDNKLTTFSQNEYIVNNECTIPASLLDENCQGDIVAYINVSGNDYDVVVYEVYIPVIKRAKPENFLRPAIDLPTAVVASFADGADGVPLEKLNLPLLPTQDLHGYDYPWVGGGGKNKADAGAFETGVVNTDGTIVKGNTTINSQGNGEVAWTSTATWRGITSDYIPVNANTSYRISLTETPSYVLYAWYQADKTFISRASYNASNPVSITSPSNGAYVRFTLQESAIGSYDYHNIQIEEGSSETAYAPYENICPITGYTEANVTRTGKNLFGINFLTGDDITIANGEASGTAKAFYFDFGRNGASVPIPNFPSGSVTLSIEAYTNGNETTSGTGLYVRIYYTDDSFDGIGIANNTSSYQRFSFSTNANKTIQRLMFSYSSGTNNIWHLKNIQLESGSSASVYEPYKGQTYNIPFSFEGQNIFTRENETENSYINSSGNISTSTAYCLSDYIEVEECKRYVFDASTANITSGVYHAFYNAEKTRITFTSCSQEFFIPPTGAKYVRLSYRKDAGASDFHISIGTVPHGTLDVKSGILTVDYAYINDLSAYHFVRSSASLTYIFNTLQLTNMKAPPTNVGRLEGCASSGYKMSLTSGVNANMTPYTMLRNNARLYFRNDDYDDDPVSFRASLNGQQAIYELASPCTYQLTPTEVKTLLGYNNIWADTGEVEVSYYPDPYLHFET